VDKAIMGIELATDVQLTVTSKQFPQLGYSQTVQDRTCIGRTR
jgi:hypothetical protein